MTQFSASAAGKTCAAALVALGLASAGTLLGAKTAVAGMDEMTQRNAALVEETTAAAQALNGQAIELADAVGFFRNGPADAAPAAAPAVAAPVPVAAQAAKPAAVAAAPVAAPAARTVTTLAVVKAPAPRPVSKPVSKPALKPVSKPAPAVAAADDDWQEF